MSGWLVNSELAGMWKEVAVTQYWALSSELAWVEWRKSGKGLNMKQSVPRPRCEPATRGHKSQLDIAFCGFSLELGCRRQCRTRLLGFWQSRPPGAHPQFCNGADRRGLGWWWVVDPEVLCNLCLIFSNHVYTGCPRRNVPDFGRVFPMLKYTDIT